MTSAPAAEPAPVAPMVDVPSAVEHAPRDSLTLEEALAEAERANAALPSARFEMEGALARERQARGQLYPALSFDGDVHGGTPQSYESSDARFRALLESPVYQGGELRAELARARAEVTASRARYRIQVRDLDRDVRVAYSRVLWARSSADARARSLEELRSYLSAVEARRSGGEGVGADLARTRQRVATAEADVAAAEREMHGARMELNDLIGRTPDDSTALAALPPPTFAPSVPGRPWMGTPDLDAAGAEIAASSAGLRAARSGRKPHVSLEADAGDQTILGTNAAPLNDGEGWGAQVLLVFNVPIWDAGLIRGRIQEADAALMQAKQQAVVAERAARLAWQSAASDLSDLARETRARSDAVDAARDAYLESESLYRGGQGTALDVLDAYDAWTQAEQDRLGAILSYRAAEADLIRWGTP